MRRTAFRCLEQMRQLTLRDPKRLTGSHDRRRPGDTVLNGLDIDAIVADREAVNASSTLSHDERLSTG